MSCHAAFIQYAVNYMSISVAACLNETELGKNRNSSTNNNNKHLHNTARTNVKLMAVSKTLRDFCTIRKVASTVLIGST